MTTDDTLELDTIIEESSNTNSITKITQGGNHNLNVINTQTEIFDPIDTGVYKLDVNGQKLSIKVTEDSEIPNSIIENFDEIMYENQSRSLSDIYGGDTEQFNRSKTVSQDGSYALSGTGVNQDKYISDTDDLNHPEQGDIFEYYSRVNNTNWHSGMLFATQSESSPTDCYMVWMNWGTSTLRIERLSSDGTKTPVGTNTNVNVSSGEWYRFEIEWNLNGEINVTLNRMKNGSTWSASGTDNSYKNGGVGWYFRDGNLNTTYYLDGARFL